MKRRRAAELLRQAGGDRVDRVSRIAGAWAQLVKRLGYTRRAAQGGDWGAVVTTALGAMQPEGLVGIHLNTPYAFPDPIPDTLSPEQRYAVETLARYNGEIGGSSHLQGTKPQTLGFALADSPAGQAAWIYEKFQSKTTTTGWPRTPSAWTPCST
jgi:pimeloyl-ACP methyl ester carboxylesterase